MKRKMARFAGLLLTMAMTISMIPSAMAAGSGDRIQVLMEEDEEVFSMPDDGNDKDLFAGYVARAFGVEEDFFQSAVVGEETVLSTAATYGTVAGNRLTGQNRTLYLLLKPLLKQVADGKVTSTKFTIPFESITGKSTYTAQDLGVPALLENQGGVWKLTAAASEKVSGLLTYDGHMLMEALMNDCPYELYWYNKVNTSSRPGGMTVGRSYQLSYSTTPTGGIDVSSAKIIPTFKISFSVITAYSAGDRYTVNPSTAKTVAAAVANADKIVSTVAAQNLSDYQILQEYRDTIQGLSEYNTAAADPGYTGGFGDPWQMIWLFDGKPTTKVVCEGYSKGFQYLCDKTNFRGSVTSAIVAGRIPQGDHMWNVVKMSNGKTYLADLTNCGTRAARGENYLFLAGADSGDPEKGYVVDGVYYGYDNDTLNLYAESQLTLAGGDYSASEDSAPTLGRPVEEDHTGVTGIVKNSEGKWTYVENGVFKVVTGLALRPDNGKWYFVRDGVYEPFTGGAPRISDGKWFYVKAGLFDNTFTGFAQCTDKVWRYFEKGSFKAVTGFANRPDNGKWYFVRSGVYDNTYTGGAGRISDGKWFYVKAGQYDNTFTGFAKCTDGVWRYFEKGGFKAVTGFANRPDNGKWYYVKNGVYDNTYTGLAPRISDGKLFYVNCGQYDNTFSGNVSYNGTTYKVVKGIAQYY